MKKLGISLNGYTEFLGNLKDRIRSARMNAARAVNRGLIRLYWDIGKAVVEKQERLGWGESVVDVLAADLQKTFPGVTGFSARNLRSMKQFYIAYRCPPIWLQAVAKLKMISPSKAMWRQPVTKLVAEKQQEFLQQAIEEIPWGQHLLILNKLQKPETRLFYLRWTARFGWSRNVLLNQIKAKTYERSIMDRKAHNFPAALPEPLSEQVEEAFKSSYNLEFLGISRVARERELEGLLIEQLQQFILELGYGFCFVGRQHRVTLGGKEYFIDLLFYHRFLKALVAIELKAGPFEPEFAGKMDFYLNVLNSKERGPDDHPSIGIILCAQKNNLEVEFSLKTKGNPIGVAEYQLVEKLPKELKGKLPTAQQLSEALRLSTSKLKSH
jgi:predicted nuclease of restriction endonuclease-like (RecB) superfamily